MSEAKRWGISFLIVIALLAVIAGGAYLHQYHRLAFEISFVIICVFILTAMIKLFYFNDK